MLSRALLYELRKWESTQNDKREPDLWWGCGGNAPVNQGSGGGESRALLYELGKWESTQNDKREPGSRDRRGVR